MKLIERIGADLLCDLTLRLKKSLRPLRLCEKLLEGTRMKLIERISTDLFRMDHEP